MSLVGDKHWILFKKLKKNRPFAEWTGGQNGGDDKSAHRWRPVQSTNDLTTSKKISNLTCTLSNLKQKFELKRKSQKWSEKVERTCRTEQNGDVGGTLSVCGVDDHIIFAKFCSRIHIKTQKQTEKSMKKHWKKKANKQTGETFQLIDTAFPPKSTRDEHTHTNTHTHSGHFLLFLGVPGAVQFYLPFPPSGAPLTPTIGGLVARLSPGGAGSGGLCPKISAAKSLFFSICSLFFFNVLSLKF